MRNGTVCKAANFGIARYPSQRRASPGRTNPPLRVGQRLVQRGGDRFLHLARRILMPMLGSACGVAQPFARRRASALFRQSTPSGESLKLGST